MNGGFSKHQQRKAGEEENKKRKKEIYKKNVFNIEECVL